MAKNLTLLAGTTKGAFLIEGGADRSGWSVSGPHCEGWPINHVIGDPATGMIWAAGGGDWHGAGIWRSADGGKSWSLCKLSKGKMDEWAASDPDFAAIIGWTDVPGLSGPRSARSGRCDWRGVSFMRAPSQRCCCAAATAGRSKIQP